MKKRIAGILLALVMILALLPVTAEAAVPVVYNGDDMPTFQRTVREIKSRYLQATNLNNGYVEGNSSTYYSVPASTVKPYNKGVLKADTLAAMAEMTNFFRFLAGVESAQVNQTSDDSLQAQALDRNFEFAHVISQDSKPEDMSQEQWDEGFACDHSILAWGYTPRGAITGWMNEGYSLYTGKWNTLGHRNAIISPATKSIYFGYCGITGIGDSFRDGNGYGQYDFTGDVHDDNGNGILGPEDESYAYNCYQQGGYWGFKEAFSAFPAPGPMPNWVIRPNNSAWNVRLNLNNLRIVDYGAVTVTVTNLRTGEAYVCTEANEKANVFTDSVEFVQPDIRESGASLYTDSYQVTITGLKEMPSRKDAVLTYTVRFFSESDEPVIITTKPTSQTVANGKTATFKVVASGSGLTYQWYYSKNNGSTWTEWSGKTAASFTVTASETNNGCLYRCEVKNNIESVTSGSAKLTVSGVKPKITAQPAAKTVASGSTATFKVVAGGSGLTYQWYYSKNNGSTWTSWSGKTSATLSLPGSETNNGYLYRCVIKNSYGTVTSGSAKLTVSGVKPKITAQPAAKTVANGSTATFKVIAGGGGLTYQWYYSKNNGSTWTSWSGKTRATLSLPGSETNNGYLYRCEVKNSYGSVTSSSAKLTVSGVKPKITAQPAAKTVANGSTATFKVVAGGSGLTYQWYYSKNNGSTWTSWSGKTNATLSLPGSETNNGYLYRCVIKNSYGSVTSSSAELTVSGVKPKITAQPANQTVASGKSVTFKVVAGGSGLSYQWQYSKNNGSTWTNWSGKTAASFSVTASATNNGCLYRCIITNSYGSVTSNSAKLTVK